MGKKILCVSYIEDSVYYLEIEKQRAGYFPQGPTAATGDSLLAACKRADEIYINSTFPSALYEWELFPKVSEKHLTTLVERAAAEKYEAAQKLEVRFKNVGEAVEDGVSKFQVAYVAVAESQSASIRTDFKIPAKKIKAITTLPVALAGMVSREEKPAQDFLVVWTSENVSVILISSAAGLVKLARTVPVGLARNIPESGQPEARAKFSQDISRELSMTITFFKQKFRGDTLHSLYFLGNSTVQETLEQYPFVLEKLQLDMEQFQYPIVGADLDLHFQLNLSQVQNMAPARLAESLHLLANLCIPLEFNLVSSLELNAPRVDLVFNIALIMVAAYIGLAWMSTRQLLEARQATQAVDAQVAPQMQKTAADITRLKASIAEYEPVEARARFYKESLLNKPAWPVILYDLANKLPPEIIITEFTLAPAGATWNNSIKGEIRAESWEDGLKILRDFGGKLNSSRRFTVSKVDYAMGNREAKIYTFRYDLQLISGE